MTGVARSLIAKNIRALRGAHGMSQEDLAGAAEMDRSYLSMIENEHFSISADQVEKIAAVFGLQIYEMFHPETAIRATRNRQS